jgi:hypothetical protein
MAADPDRYVPNPDGPLAKGLPPGYLRGWQYLRLRPWNGEDDRTAQRPGGGRWSGWTLLCLGLQWLAFSALAPRATEPLGLLAQNLNAAFTPWTLFLFLALLLPALAFTAIVPPPQVSFRRAFLFGLGTAAALLLLFLLIFSLSFFRAYAQSHMSSADFLEALGLRR